MRIHNAHGKKKMREQLGAAMHMRMKEKVE